MSRRITVIAAARPRHRLAPHVRYLSTLLLLAATLPLAGCGRPTGVSDPPAAGQSLTTGTAVGQLVPETEGEDLDGVTFRLGDYRGKVVVLDFWGDW